MMNPDNDDGKQRTTLSESERHELLADEIRREAIAILQRTDDELSLMDVAHTVWTRPSVRDQQTGVQSVKIALHHNHLPKLDAHGLIDYDFGEQTIVENDIDSDVFGPE